MACAQGASSSLPAWLFPERGRGGLGIIGCRAGTWGSALVHLGIRLAWPCRQDLPPLLTESAAGEQSLHVPEASVGFQKSPRGPRALGQPLPRFLCAEGLRGLVCTGEPLCGLRGTNGGQQVSQFTAAPASASEAACEPGGFRHPRGLLFPEGSCKSRAPETCLLGHGLGDEPRGWACSPEAPGPALRWPWAWPALLRFFHLVDEWQWNGCVPHAVFSSLPPPPEAGQA